MRSTAFAFGLDPRALTKIDRHLLAQPTLEVAVRQIELSPEAAHAALYGLVAAFKP